MRLQLCHFNLQRRLFLASLQLSLKTKIVLLILIMAYFCSKIKQPDLLFRFVDEDTITRLLNQSFLRLKGIND